MKKPQPQDLPMRRPSHATTDRQPSTPAVDVTAHGGSVGSASRTPGTGYKPKPPGLTTGKGAMPNPSGPGGDARI